MPENVVIVVGINVKIISFFFLLHYLTVLVNTKTTIHLSVGGQC